MLSFSCVTSMNPSGFAYSDERGARRSAGQLPMRYDPIRPACLAENGSMVIRENERDASMSGCTPGISSALSPKSWARIGMPSVGVPRATKRARSFPLSRRASRETRTPSASPGAAIAPAATDGGERERRNGFREVGVLIQLEGRACGDADERDAGNDSDSACLESASAGGGFRHGMPSLATRRTA